MTDPREWIAARRAVLIERLAGTERRLADVRGARGEWIDEEHDPEGFALTFEWQQAQGALSGVTAELRELQDAESRLAAGDYGTCRECGSDIPAAQLELRPARTVCVACVSP